MGTVIRYFFLWLLLSLAVTSSGCVKKSLYEKTMGDYENTLREKELVTQELKTCQDKVKSTESDLTTCQSDLENKSTEAARLKDQSTSLKTDLDETSKAVDEMRQRAAQQEERIKTYREMLAQFKRLIEGGKLDVQVIRGRMVVKLGEGVLFDSGSAAIKPSGKAVLDEVTQVLAAIPNRSFQIEGHTDNLPTRTSSAYPSNWELSAARALSVVKYMIEQGMDPARVSGAGYGEFTPIVSNDTPELRALNRRIEIVLMPNLDELPTFEDLDKVQ